MQRPPGGTLPPVVAEPRSSGAGAAMTPRPPTTARASPNGRPVYQGRAPQTARAGGSEVDAMGDAAAGVHRGRPSTTPAQESSLHYGESFDLPELKGVDKTKWALKQDAMNHKMKWSPAAQRVGPSPDTLISLADDLWRLGEEQKHAVDQEPWVPDARTRNIREQLVRMAEALAEAPGAVRPSTTQGSDRLRQDDAALYPSTAPTEETDRLRQELAESQARVAALESSGNSVRLREELAASQAKVAALESNDETARLRDELASSQRRIVALEEAPKSITMTENARLRRELQERHGKVSALESTFTAYLSERERHRASLSSIRDYGVKGRFLLHDVSLILQVCAAWSNAVASARCDRQQEAEGKRRRALAAAVRSHTFDFTQRQEEVLRQSACFGTWMASIGKARSEAEAKQRALAARKRLASSLGRWLDLGDQAALHECMAVWAGVAREEKARRGGEEACLRVREEARVAKEKLVQRFGQTAMNQMLRKISANEGSCLETHLSAWLRVFNDGRKERELEAERARSRAATAAARAKAVQLAMGGTDGALKAEAMQLWQEARAMAVAAKLAAQRKEQAMKTAMRGIMHTQAALMQDVFATYVRICKEEKLALALGGGLQKEAALRERAKKGVMAMFERKIAGSAKKLLYETTIGWYETVQRDKRSASRREQVTQKVLRNIAGEAELMRSLGFTSWAKLAKDDRDMALERGRRRRIAELGRFSVIKLRDRLCMRSAWDGWYIRTIL